MTSVSEPSEILAQAVKKAGSVAALARALDYDEAGEARLRRAANGKTANPSHEIVSSARNYLRPASGQSNVSADTSPARRPSITEMLDEVPAGRYDHLIEAGRTWDWELLDPETGDVRAAVRISFHVAGDTRQRTMRMSETDA